MFAAFVVGFVGLSVEIAYTRVISFKLFYYYTYFVIGLALLGLGSASAVTSLSSRLRRADPLLVVRRAAPAAAIAGVIGFVVVARVRTDTNKIWDGSAGEVVQQLGLLLVLSLSITAVFFAAGLILASLFVAEVERVRRLYFWDLTGAALGALTAVPLQATIGPPAMIAVSLVALAVLGGLAIAVDDDARRSFAERVVAVAVAVATVGGAFVMVSTDVVTDATKTIGDGSGVLAGDWGAVFRVDVTQGFGDLYILHHDGLWGAGIWKYDGTPATTDQYLVDNRQIPFAAIGDDPNVLIIGAAGGHEIQASLVYGAGSIDAVELNPVTVGLLTGEFAEFSGNITSHPDVNYTQGDGRTYLARTDEAYDLIWFVAPDSYAASNAATAGAFVLSESYLYTEEMLETAYEHLTPGGVIVAQFGDLDFEERPMRTARYLVTARAALGDDVDDFSDHVALAYESGEGQIATISTIVISKGPIDAATAERIDAAVGNVPNATTLYLPGVHRVDGITSDVIDVPDAELGAVVAGSDEDISSIDDSRPFFWHFTGFSEALTDWGGGFVDAEIAIGERLIGVLLAIAAVVAALLLFLPFAVIRGDRAKLPGRSRLFVYFASLGLGFMFVEISMIQRFALLLGFPTLSLSVSLCTLLVATAIGARASTLIERHGGRAMAGVFGALVALVVIYLLTADAITTTALAWSQPARIAVVVALLAPIGLLLGTFLPTGMAAVARAVPAGGEVGAERQGRAVAWCWAVNGFFSVLGATFTTMLSMTVGFDDTLLAGLALYAVATAVIISTGRSVLPSTAQ